MTVHLDPKALGLRATPAFFVLLWSTGFLGAKYGLPYAEPFTFLAVRMAIAALLLTALALLMKTPWPSSPVLAGHIAVSGILVHAGYLGGVFNAISLAMPAGIAALIVGMQPLLTAGLSGWLLGENIGLRQWLGLLLGFAGTCLVVLNQFGTTGASFAGIVSTLVALLADYQVARVRLELWCCRSPVSGSIRLIVCPNTLVT